MSRENSSYEEPQEIHDDGNWTRVTGSLKQSPEDSAYDADKADIPSEHRPGYRPNNSEASEQSETRPNNSEASEQSAHSPRARRESSEQEFNDFEFDDPYADDDVDGFEDPSDAWVSLSQVTSQPSLQPKRALAEVLDILSVARAAAEDALKDETHHEASAQGIKEVLQLLSVAPPSPEAARLQRHLEAQLRRTASKSTARVSKSHTQEGALVQTQKQGFLAPRPRLQRQKRGLDMHGLFSLLSTEQRDEFAEMYLRDTGK